MDDTGNAAANESINGIFSLFFDEAPISAEIIDTSRGGSDFRNAVIVTSKEGAKYVLKIASNDFTFPEKIAMWQKTIEEYRDLGYYCPRIIADKQGLFPKVKYQDRDCYAFAEEYSKYKTLGSPDRSAQDVPGEEYDKYLKDIWRMTARIASKRLDYTDFPSAHCLFETFCPRDKIDEVLACALRWKELAESLPKEFAEQVQRIWRLWNENREMLKKIYPALPTSVFQADLNRSNLLIDEEGNFKGVLDFNICGKDVFLNYLMRDSDSDMIPKVLKISSEYYIFSEEEKEAAPLLYRCLEPLCYGSIHDLKNAGNDAEAIKQSLDQSEKCLTEHIDFKSFMQ